MVPCVNGALSELHKIITNKEFCGHSLLLSMEEVCQHIDSVLSRKVVVKRYSDEYLVSVCFNKNVYMTPAVAKAYCQINLVVGVKYLRMRIELVEKAYKEFGESAILEASEIFHNYLHDFRPLIEYVAREKDKEYVFFKGSKSAAARTQDLFYLSKALSQARLAVAREFRTCNVASIFVLRQALEVKFERLVGVEFIDGKFKAPKLWHGFQYDFIKGNLHFFEFQGFDFLVLRQIYDWCSMMVHSADMPLAWLLPMAHDYCEGLFGSGADSADGYWNVYGAVRVIDKEAMQQAYAEFFSKKYDHGIFCVYFGETESVPVEKYI